MKYNLHTHSFYCRHGHGSISDYIKRAESLNYDLLGFSEHNPYPTGLLEENHSRMHFPMKQFYENDVRVNSLHTKVKVLLGYECDMWPGYDNYLKDLTNSVDYTIFGVHFLPGSDGLVFSPFNNTITKKGNLKLYVDYFLHGLELGCFSFAAHPDVFFFGYGGIWNQETKAASIDILQAAKQIGLPLEVNANGIAKAISKNNPVYLYPNRNFWELASEMGISCVLSDDAHEVLNLGGNEQRLRAFVKELNLKVLEPTLSSNNHISFN